MHASVGTCYGYHVHSGVPLAGLRSGEFGDRLEIAIGRPRSEPIGEPMFRWEAREGQEFSGRLWIEDGRYVLVSDREGWFEIDPAAPSIVVPGDTDPHARERRLWGIPAVLCFLRRGDLSVHAAAVDVDGGAVLLAAPGRFGKSTLAAGFHRAGFRVLSEDISCCRPGSLPLVFPGPAMLRLRPDVRSKLSLPGTKAVAEEIDRVHLTFDDANRGGGAPLPLRGVVFLRRREEGDDAGATMERLEPTRALPDVWALSWRLPLTDDVVRCFEGVTSLVSSVPVWNLYRVPTLDALDEVVDLIVATTASA